MATYTFPGRRNLLGAETVPDVVVEYSDEADALYRALIAAYPDSISGGSITGERKPENVTMRASLYRDDEPTDSAVFLHPTAEKVVYVRRHKTAVNKNIVRIEWAMKTGTVHITGKLNEFDAEVLTYGAMALARSKGGSQ